MKVDGRERFDFDVLWEGDVNACKEYLPESGDSDLKDFEFNIELLTANGGVWVKKASFTKLDYSHVYLTSFKAERLAFSEMPDPDPRFSRNVLTVEYSPGDTRSESSKLPWSSVNPGRIKLSGTWEQKATVRISQFEDVRAFYTTDIGLPIG